MLIFKGKLHNVFKRQDYEDKKTGEIKPAKYQLEFMEQKEMLQGQGKETVLQKISIPDELFPTYKDKIGQMVEVPIDVMSNNGRIIYYGINR
jgi:hypothetical protein